MSTWLSDESLRVLFSERTPAGEALTVMAALLLLPEGWDTLLREQLQRQQQSPRHWLSGYVKAVLQVGGC